MTGRRRAVPALGGASLALAVRRWPGAAGCVRRAARARLRGRRRHGHRRPGRASASSRSTCAGTTLDGAPLDVAAFRGKVVVLNVWGSWCAPCRKEAPDLQAAYDRAEGRRASRSSGSTPATRTRRRPRPSRTLRRSPTRASPTTAAALLLALRGAVAPERRPDHAGARRSRAGSPPGSAAPTTTAHPASAWSTDVRRRSAAR